MFQRSIRFCSILNEVCPEIGSCKQGDLNTPRLPSLKKLILLGNKRQRYILIVFSFVLPSFLFNFFINFNNDTFKWILCVRRTRERRWRVVASTRARRDQTNAHIIRSDQYSIHFGIYAVWNRFGRFNLDHSIQRPNRELRAFPRASCSRIT